MGTDKLKEQRLAIGDPQVVPAGQYAVQIFDHLIIRETALKKAVLGQTVRTVLTYVARNEVDAGVVYLTDALLMKDEVDIVEHAPPGSHEETIYPAAVVNTGYHPAEGKTFLDFLFTDKANTIFRKYGFQPIETNSTTSVVP